MKRSVECQDDTAKMAEHKGNGIDKVFRDEAAGRMCLQRKGQTMGNNGNFGDQLRRQSTPEPAGLEPVQREIGQIVYSIQYYCERAAGAKKRSCSGYFTGSPAPADEDGYALVLVTPDQYINPTRYSSYHTSESIKGLQQVCIRPKDPRVIAGVQKAFENRGLKSFTFECRKFSKLFTDYYFYYFSATW